MVVYTYGRYEGTYGKPGNPTPPGQGSNGSGISRAKNGPGVLVRMTGEAAQAFNNKKIAETGATTFLIKDADEKKVAQYYDKLFNSSTQRPTSGDYAGSDDARVIDSYVLGLPFTKAHNCATTCDAALHASGSKALDPPPGSSAPTGYDPESPAMLEGTLGLDLIKQDHNVEIERNDSTRK